MKRPVLFFVDTIDVDGKHKERYLNLLQYSEDIEITTQFFNEVLLYFNYGCDGCTNDGYLAVDIVRIIDNGEQIYFDGDVNGSDYGE